MGIDAVHRANISVDDADGGDQEAEMDKVYSLEDFVGEMIGHFGRDGELLTRVELDIACSSEKLLNLNALMMNVAMRKSDFEVFASEEQDLLADSFEKALEFDLLSKILYSEVRELQKFMVGLQTETVHARELISACKNMGESFSLMEKKLLGSEESLKQLQEQVLDIRTQSAMFRRTLACFYGEENWNIDMGANGDFLEDEQLLNTDTGIKMQTADQQRDILIMLEKSLAREMDLENKLTESRQVEEELKQRLLCYENELSCREEETSIVWEKLFEADNVGEVFMGISKEILGRLHILQFNLNGSLKREAELQSKLASADEQLKSQESTLKRLESGEARLNDFFVAQTESLKASLSEIEEKLIIVSSEAFTLREKVSSLENQLKCAEFQQPSAKVSNEEDNDLHDQISELENVIEDLKDNLSKAENRAESAEARCKLLSETNMELNEEVCLRKGSESTYERVESLERQLQESDIQLQHAVASLEASLEKQSMLYSTIADMENLIEDLKLKVSKAESRADSAEDKCIILSESHADLNEELNFLRGRMECLEAALQQSEGTKLATAKDIGIRTKVITNLVMQLTIERERLHKQISSLAKENRILVVKLQQTSKDSSAYMSQDTKENGKDSLFCNRDQTPCTKDGEEEVTDVLTTNYEMNKTRDNKTVLETEMESVDSTTEIETVSRIDAGVLNMKHVFMAILVLLIAAAVYLFQQPNCPF